VSSLLVLAALRIETLALGDIADAHVLRTGMGPDRARIAAARAQASDAAAVAVAGLCAGVAPGLRAGDAICASELVTADGTRIAVTRNPFLEEALGRRGLRVHVGPMFSAQRILGPTDRKALPDGILGVDMESAWLAPGAAGRPFAVIRVVVDAAGRRLADPRLALEGPRALLRLHRVGAALADWAATSERRELLEPHHLSTATSRQRAFFS
jgi:4-hydroxy-3-methylbut-2-enyl diphosphate reductase